MDDLWDFISNPLGGVLTWVRTSAVDLIQTFISDWFTIMWDVMGFMSEIDLPALMNPTNSYSKLVGFTAGLAIFVALALFLFNVIKGFIDTARGKPGSNPVTAAVNLGKSILSIFVFGTLTWTAIQLVDQLSAGMIKIVAGGFIQGSEKLTTTLTIAVDGLVVSTAAGAPAMGVLAVAIPGIILVAGVIMVILSLFIRQTLLLVIFALMPLALAGFAGGDLTRGWPRKMIAFLFALIVSKLVLVLVVSIAIALLT